ncbi:MAG: HEPN domain-containing protein [Candidatus Poribacteria bacterium]|nr:HEPN domain-containing protein [Candidatus Poribacteria bacterium]
MSEDERLFEVRRWLRYAQEDLTAAVAMIGRREIAPRHICWLAQQSAEKALKAVLVFLQIDFPRTHDLDALRNFVPIGWTIQADLLDLASLTEWAVEARYPGDWPEAIEADARFAVKQAQAILATVMADFAQHGFDVEKTGEGGERSDGKEPG